jgi:hypothetical protein
MSVTSHRSFIHRSINGVRFSMEGAVKLLFELQTKSQTSLVQKSANSSA